MGKCDTTLLATECYTRGKIEGKRERELKRAVQQLVSQKQSMCHHGSVSGCGRNGYYPRVKVLVAYRRKRSAWTTWKNRIGPKWGRNALLNGENDFGKGSKKASVNRWTCIQVILCVKIISAVVRQELSHARSTNLANGRVKVAKGTDCP